MEQKDKLRNDAETVIVFTHIDSNVSVGDGCEASVSASMGGLS